MPNNLNRFLLTGNLTRDPDFRPSDGPHSVVFIDVACNRQWRDNEGSTQEQVTYLRLKDFGRRAENHSQYLRKGMRVVVEGRMENNNYERDGMKRYEIDFIIEHIEYPPRD